MISILNSTWKKSSMQSQIVKKNLGLLIRHEESEYKSRLLQTLVIHSAKCLPNTSAASKGSHQGKIGGEFHHYKRGTGYSVYHFLFGKKIPGRLEQIALDPNYIVNFQDPEIEDLDQIVEFDEESQKYTFHLDKPISSDPMPDMLRESEKSPRDLLLHLFKRHLRSNEYEIDQDILRISKESWDKLTKSLDYAKDIREPDFRHDFDLRAQAQNIEELKELFNDEVRQSTCAITEHFAITERKLQELRESKCKKGDFIRHLIDQEYRTLEKSLAENLNRPEVQEISDLLNVDKDLKDTERTQIIEGLKKFRDNFLLDKAFIKGFTGGHGVLNTQQHFRRVANDINIYLSLLDRCHNGSYEYPISRKALYADEKFQAILEETNQILLIYDGLCNRDRFSYKAPPAEKKPSATGRETLSERIHYAFACIPVICILSAIITSLLNKAEVKLNTYENSTSVAQSIRSKLGIEIKKEWRGLNHRDVRIFHYTYREKYNLIGGKEKIQLYHNNMRWYFKILAAAFVGTIIILKIAEAIGLFKSNQRLFFVEVTAIFYFILVAFCIDAFIGIVRDKLFTCAVSTVKFVDQYLFGKLFTRLFNIILLGIKDGFKVVCKFFKELSHNFAEHGFVQGMKETYNNTHPLDAMNGIPDKFSEFFNELFAKYEIEDENTYSFSRMTLNIFDPIGSSIKLGKYIGRVTSGKSGNAALLSDYLEQQRSDSLNSQKDGESQDKTDAMRNCHNELLKHFLMKQDWVGLDARFEKLFKSSPETKVMYRAPMDGLSGSEPERFSSKEFAMALAIEYLRSSGCDIKAQMTSENSDSSSEHSHTNDRQIEQRVQLIDYILKRLEEEKISQIIDRNETFSRNTRLDYEIRNGLTVYKAIIQQYNGQLTADHLEKLDEYFKDYFINSMELIKGIDHSSTRRGDDEMKLFDSLSIKHIGLKKCSSKVEKICYYVDLERGNISLLDVLIKAFKDFIDTITSPTTIISFGIFYYIALPELFDIQWLVSIDDLKEIFIDAKTTQILLNGIGVIMFPTEKINDFEIITKIFSKYENSSGASEILAYSLRKERTKHEAVLTDVLNQVLSFFRRLFGFNALLDSFSGIFRTTVKEAQFTPLVTEQGQSLA